MLNNFYESDDYLEYLILNGYVEVAGIDEENGEFLYNFTQTARQKVPGLQDQLNNEFYGLVIYLWEHGFVSMDIESQNPMVTLNPKALNKNEVDQLPYVYKAALLTIINVLRIK
jgi:hypothetical protein